MSNEVLDLGDDNYAGNLHKKIIEGAVFWK